MKKREFVLKVSIGLGCIAAFILLVSWKQNVVQTKRDQDIVSTISEWEKSGKPVIVQKIAHTNMKVYTKITITPLSKKLFEGYVTKSVQEQLRTGQSVYIEEKGGKFFGSIRYVGQAINVDTGMFRVRVAFNHDVEPGHHIIVGYVHTGTMKNVISVPNEIIDSEDEKYFLWKIRDGYAYKQNVVLGDRNSYGAIVVKGLHDGDMVVIEGQTQLSNNDRVKIVGNKEVVRVSND